MDKQQILQSYMTFFRKKMSEWVATSTKYEERNRVRDFNTVMLEMDRFTKRFVGPNNYSVYRDSLINYLLRNAHIMRTGKTFDVRENTYNEYKKL